MTWAQTGCSWDWGSQLFANGERYRFAVWVRQDSLIDFLHKGNIQVKTYSYLPFGFWTNSHKEKKMEKKKKGKKYLNI